MTIISLIKQVPLPSEMRMGEDGAMDRTKAKSIINIDCQFGLEAGLQLKKQYPDARMVVVSMGPPPFEQSLKNALSMGYDEAYLLSDRKLGGSDTFATGLAISTLLKNLGFGKVPPEGDLGGCEPFIVLAGRQSSDGDTAHVPSQVAEAMGLPQATFVERITPNTDGTITARRIIEGGYQMLKLPLPCVVSFTPTGIKPRKASLVGAIKARHTDIGVKSVDDVQMPLDEQALVGTNGSPTKVAGIENIESDRPPVMMAVGQTETQLVDSLIENLKKGGNALVKKEKKEKAETDISEFEIIDQRGDNKGILTWVEVVKGDIARPSLELLTPARHLADQLGNDTKITSVLIGKNVKNLAQKLFEHGADEVIVV
ncbi:MAG: electron transfer flavoprotein subunit alpha, partial [Prevotellaceae bacterium]|nr:electron transfer flavoprotein subunit alpha [Prevotellaceae bacterium]